jgi:hypothetical protein
LLTSHKVGPNLMFLKVVNIPFYCCLFHLKFVDVCIHQEPKIALDESLQEHLLWGGHGQMKKGMFIHIVTKITNSSSIALFFPSSLLSSLFLSRKFNWSVYHNKSTYDTNASIYINKTPKILNKSKKEQRTYSFATPLKIGPHCIA